VRQLREIVRRFGDTIATVVAMSAGFLMTLALLYDGVFVGPVATLMSDRGIESFLRGFIPASARVIQVTATLAIVIGLLNLLLVHVAKLVRIRRYGLNAIWSLLLVVCAVGVIIIATLETNGTLVPPDGEPTYTAILRDTVQFSVEASLAGLLAFSLIYGAFRFSRRRFDIPGVVFLAALILNLLFQAGLRFQVFDTVAETQQVIVGAGANGILLGIALATVVAGVRVLIGQDRSYRE
jgi:hypothetical protein